MGCCEAKLDTTVPREPPDTTPKVKGSREAKEKASNKIVFEENEESLSVRELEPPKRAPIPDPPSTDHPLGNQSVSAHHQSGRMSPPGDASIGNRSLGLICGVRSIGYQALEPTPEYVQDRIKAIQLTALMKELEAESSHGDGSNITDDDGHQEGDSTRNFFPLQDNGTPLNKQLSSYVFQAESVEATPEQPSLIDIVRVNRQGNLEGRGGSNTERLDASHTANDTRLHTDQDMLPLAIRGRRSSKKRRGEDGTTVVPLQNYQDPVQRMGASAGGSIGSLIAAGLSHHLSSLDEVKDRQRNVVREWVLDTPPVVVADMPVEGLEKD